MPSEQQQWTEAALHQVQRDKAAVDEAKERLWLYEQSCESSLRTQRRWSNSSERRLHGCNSMNPYDPQYEPGILA